MRAVKLQKKDLNRFLKSVEPFGELWGPVKNGDKYSLSKIESFSEIQTKALRTKIPFKKLFSPPEFPMYSFTKEGMKEELSDIPKRVIFGLHPCDIHALMIMDRFFTINFVDPYYMERRRKTAIIGLSCIPDDLCFCKTTNTSNVEKGFDLFLTELDDFFLLWIGSSLGDDMVRGCPQLIDEEVTHNDLEKYITWRKSRESKFTLNMDFTGMPGIMELSYDHPMWDELGEKCLSCGACTIVCPTCSCYNVKDEVELNTVEGKRVRVWDSCMFREYSIVADGHNFREARSERLKLRFIHKLQAFIGAYDEPACVGCGRCIDTCPVGIDIRTVGMRLKGEEVKI